MLPPRAAATSFGSQLASSEGWARPELRQGAAAAGTLCEVEAQLNAELSLVRGEL
eukprot:COSAG06_NODE_57217_length_281_cov_0.791209_1_plen_54_part_01